jgi:hypothetical protein
VKHQISKFKRELPNNFSHFRRQEDREMHAQTLFDTKWMYLLAMANFCRDGKKTFFLSEGITERLSQTDLNVPAKMVMTPFPSCMLVFDDPVTRSLINKGAMSESVDLTSHISVIVTTMSSNLGRSLSVKFYRGVFKRRTFLSLRCNFILGENEMLEQSLWRSVYNDAPVPDAVKIGLAPDPDDDVRCERSHKLHRIVCNALLYLSSRAPEISGDLWAVDRVPPLPEQSSPKAKRGRAGYLKSLSQHPYVEVGPSIKRLERDHPPEMNSPAVRFLVRGHWRNQAHGEGRSLRTFKWIEPFWKGPEMAEIVNKPYRVDGRAPTPDEGNAS